jgi:hypothetical protein
MRWGYAAAALLVFMVSVGVPRYLTEEPPTSASIDSADIELRAPADVPGRATLPAPAAPAVERHSAEPRRAPTVPVASPAAVTPRAVMPPTSLRVVHQHRLGSCRGSLVVSRDGLAFVPDEREGDAQHGFTLRNGQFLHGLGGDNLTIKSNDKVYRFKPAVVTGKDDDQLAKLVASMTRLQ